MTLKSLFRGVVMKLGIYIMSLYYIVMPDLFCTQIYSFIWYKIRNGSTEQLNGHKTVQVTFIQI